MQIYKYYNSNKELVEYTSDNVLADEPCYILGCGLFYPLRVKEYNKFLNKYASYFTFSEEGLELQLPPLKKMDTFLDKLIIYNTILKSSIVQNKLNEDEIFKLVVKDLEDALSIVTKKQIKYIYENKCFNDEYRKISINYRNFSDVRHVIAMQNLIKEPIYYEDQEYAELMAEARRQKNKRNGGNINLSEMVAYAKVYGHLKYSDIYEQNILQLQADNFCMSQLKGYETTMLFNTVLTKFTEYHLVQAFIDDLYKPNDDSDLLREAVFDGKTL